MTSIFFSSLFRQIKLAEINNSKLRYYSHEKKNMKIYLQHVLSELLPDRLWEQDLEISKAAWLHSAKAFKRH